mgnify:CR=1 FL=1
MDTEPTQDATENGSKKKKRMIKGGTLLMISALVVLGAYYISLGVIKHRKAESVRTSEAADTATNKDKQVMKTSDADTAFDVSYLMGRFTTSKHPDFTSVDLKHGNREGLYLRFDTYEAFIRMYDAAMKDGVKLTIISAARSFDYQKSIWEAKWSGKRLVNGRNLALTISDPVERAREILTYSSMPGTSRHHWGTDLDLNSMDPKYYETEAGKKIYQWLKTNAGTYGFCQPYCAKGEGRSTGYEEEKWHWSYLPVSVKCTKAYAEKVTYGDISGFSGSAGAEQLRVIEDYVLGINTACK